MSTAERVAARTTTTVQRPRIRSELRQWPTSTPGEPLEREAERLATVATTDPLPRLDSSVIAGGSGPLPPPLRFIMERRFNHDFANVRVHADAVAASSAMAADADAYTLGTHLVFGAGRYAPATSEGLALLTHELTHVVQNQRAGGIPLVLRKERPKASPPSADAC